MKPKTDISQDVVKASYAGHQEDHHGGPGFDLWVLEEEVGQFMKGTTVSAESIRALGLALPTRSDSIVK